MKKHYGFTLVGMLTASALVLSITACVTTPDTRSVAAPGTTSVTAPDTESIAAPGATNVTTEGTGSVAAPGTTSVAAPGTTNVTAEGTAPDALAAPATAETTTFVDGQVVNFSPGVDAAAHVIDARTTMVSATFTEASGAEGTTDFTVVDGLLTSMRIDLVDENGEAIHDSFTIESARSLGGGAFAVSVRSATTGEVSDLDLSLVQQQNAWDIFKAIVSLGLVAVSFFISPIAYGVLVSGITMLTGLIEGKSGKAIFEAAVTNGFTSGISSAIDGFWYAATLSSVVKTAVGNQTISELLFGEFPEQLDEDQKDLGKQVIRALKELHYNAGTYSRGYTNVANWAANSWDAKDAAAQAALKAQAEQAAREAAAQAEQKAAKQAAQTAAEQAAQNAAAEQAAREAAAQAEQKTAEAQAAQQAAEEAAQTAAEQAAAAQAAREAAEQAAREAADQAAQEAAEQAAREAAEAELAAQEAAEQAAQAAAAALATQEEAEQAAREEAEALAVLEAAKQAAEEAVKTAAQAAAAAEATLKAAKAQAAKDAAAHAAMKKVVLKSAPLWSANKDSGWKMLTTDQAKMADLAAWAIVKGTSRIDPQLTWFVNLGTIRADEKIKQVTLHTWAYKDAQNRSFIITVRMWPDQFIDMVAVEKATALQAKMAQSAPSAADVAKAAQAAEKAKTAYVEAQLNLEVARLQEEIAGYLRLTWLQWYRSSFGEIMYFPLGCRLRGQGGYGSHSIPCWEERLEAAGLLAHTLLKGSYSVVYVEPLIFYRYEWQYDRLNSVVALVDPETKRIVAAGVRKAWERDYQPLIHW